MKTSHQTTREIEFKPRTLVDVLVERGLHQPQHTAYRFFIDGETEEIRITYGELYRQAQSIAAHLQNLQAARARALLLYPPGLEYIKAFLGCILAEVIAVPAYPPRRNRNLGRIQALASDASAAFALTTKETLAAGEQLIEHLPELENLRWIATDEVSSESAGEWREPHVSGETLAFLQYTSGSTSMPKGVMVTHEHLQHNSSCLQYSFGYTPQSVSLTWLPHFHDLGLIDGLLQPLYGGYPAILMSPEAFLQRPLRWLEAISRHRVTHSGGPNFAYDLCVRKSTPVERAALDLASWSFACNGAEPVRSETLERFAETFAPCGFRRQALNPAYGLAEATLLVVCSEKSQPPVYCNVEADALERGRIVEAEACEAGAKTLVSSGRATLDTKIVIVHPETLELCAPDELGEIWVSGPNVARGYWQREEETERTFRARIKGADEELFLRTGDLGFVKDGELFITGRLKDLIIIRGRNLYPHDIELVVERSHTSFRPGCGAAFAIELDGEEQLVVMQELDTRQTADSGEMLENVLQAVAEEFEVRLAAVVLLRPGSVPKTSSGKIQRHACRMKFLANDFEPVAVWRANTRTESEADFPPDALRLSDVDSVARWLSSLAAAKLGVEPATIDINQSLARYGIDSLTAIELAHAIETHTGVSLPMSDLLQGENIARLAGRVVALWQPSSPDSQAAPVAASAAPEADTHPLSHGQQALWFIQQIAPESIAYQIAGAVRLHGELDAAALGRAFQSLVNRHASLRTTFFARQGEPVQRVYAHAGVYFQEEDASGWSVAQLQERLHEAARRPFNLEECPLLRVYLFERTPHEHVMLLVAHHIVLDFWSLAVLMHELGALYREEQSGVPAALAPPSMPYTDYVRWQSEKLSGSEGERLASYWETELASESAALELPLDRPRPRVQTYRGASLALRLNGGLTRRLKQLSKTHETTLYTTLLAAFQVLLYRHTGQEDLLVGSPTSGRSSARFTDTVGYFVNPVVLRAKLSPRLTFTEFLAQTRQTVLRAFAHQDYPFDLLVKRLQPERDAARSPLFQVMFALHKTHLRDEMGLAALTLGEAGTRMRIGGLSMEALTLEHRIAQFDLSLTMAEVDEELAASFEFNTDLFDDSTIARMSGHFKTLLQAIAIEPSTKLSLLPLLTETEQHQLLRVWNDTNHEPRTHVCVHEAFAQRASHAPHRVAVVTSSGEETSYRELDERADRLANYLRRRGAGIDVPVGLCMERSVEMLVGLLGILKAGAAYVPLDPAYPAGRLAFMLEDARVPLIVTVEKFAPKLPPHGARVVRLDTDRHAIEAESDDHRQHPAPAAEPRGLAYIIYTSGSTGQPKGVMIEHRSLASYIAAASRHHGIRPGDRLFQFSSLNFDASVEEIFMTLASGATLVLRSNEQPAAPSDFIRHCRDMNLSVLDIPTAYWHTLTASLAPDDWRQAERLRLVIIGGEEALASRVAQWQASAGKRVRLVNTYGPTEATIVATMWDAPDASDVEDNKRVVPIGHPVEGTEAYVLDDALQPVPIGVTGELYLGGDGLARGYVNRPELSAAKFIPHPFGTERGARLYRTGDRVRLLPDGKIVFLGRADFQVKVRGFRIELSEIEAAIASHESVREAAVVARGAEGGDKRLVAYYVVRPRAALSAGELRGFLKARLPEFMLPSAFLSLDALPLTTTGKIDRRALPHDTHRLPKESYVAPHSASERILCDICAEILRLERVGIEDNFFELGGDSILSIQVVARARLSGINLTPSQVFEYPTVRELAGVAGVASVVQAEQGDVTGDVPLTPIQHWFFEQEFPAPAHWNMSVMLGARERLAPALLDEAFAYLVKHHDALRTRFVEEAGGWRQFIAEPEESGIVPVRCVDLAKLNEHEQRQALAATADETQAQLDCALSPVLRAVLFEPGRGRAQRLLIVIHHLVVDGVSWRILLEDLACVYRSLQHNEKIQLPPKTTSYKHWATRLEEYGRAGVARDGVGYWTNLSGVEAGRLPIDIEGGANVEGSARRVSVSLEREETRSLLQVVPEVYHTQINDVLLAAVAEALARWTGERTLLVELEGHGREDLFEDVDTGRTVGWFTTAFPVLLKSEEAWTPGDALKSIKEQLRRIPKRGIDYGVARYLSGDDRLREQLRSLPQPELSFNYLGQLEASNDDAPLFDFVRESSGATRDAGSRRSHLLELDASVAGQRLHMDWTYSENIHRRATVERLAQWWLEALRAIIAHCRSSEAGSYTPSDFPLAPLSQPALDAILQANRHEVSDIYPLSPVQQGMLFHSLYEPAANVYAGQLSCILKGNVDAEAFERAWRHVVARHDTLRTSFVWENLDEPLQVVHREGSVKVEEHDWSMLSLAEREMRLAEFLLEDARRGFDLSTTSLMRLALVRLEADSHRFIWTHHHILLDGWSASLLMSHVFAAYEALRQQGEASVASHSRAYRDYIAWLRRQDMSGAELYWRDTLKGFRAPTRLMIDPPRKDGDAAAGRDGNRHREARLPAETTEHLQALARRHRLTLNTFVQGAWAVLLSRYGGIDDVLFGATVAGRPAMLAGVDAMVGLFINTLPVRVRVKPEMRLLDWLKHLQAEQVRLREYEYSPLVEVQGWSEVPRGQPLFESILAFENYPVDVAALKQGKNLQLSDVQSFERTNYPLTLGVVPGQGLSLHAFYDGHRFDDAAIERLLKNLQTTLENFAATPELRLADIQLITDDERRRMLRDWNATRRDYSHEPCVHEQFEAQAQQTPESVAIMSDGRHVTYRELNTRANRLAHHLIKLGVGAEARVCLCVKRSVEMIVGVLAILKAGGAYVPLDADYPRERLAFMLEDAQAVALLTEASLVERLPPEHDAQLVRLDADWEAIAKETDANPARRVTTNNLAYVIYTSGSTGTPKGVEIQHDSLINLTTWHRRTYEVTSADRATQLASPAFDASVWELWPYLTAGAAIFIPDDETRGDAARLLAWLAAHAITICFMPTPLAEMSLPEEFPPNLALRTLLTGGDKLQRVPRRTLPFVLVNHYGPTENTVVSTCGEVVTGDASIAPPIGRPIDNVEAYILDDALNPVPVGIRGELYVGGSNLARGYRRRPALCAERFIPHPFGARGGERLYRTGDVARYLADGNIEFLGRADYQVKVRGFRIELGEIEAVLSEHPSVKHCAVLAREGANGEKQLTAYVVGAEGQLPELASLRGFLKERLLAAMMPSAFVMLDELPLTSNGKVDRRALPEPEASGRETGRELVAPRTGVEEVLAGIWREVLGVEQVGVDDNFFDLGGHSLLITRVVSSVRRLLRVELRLADVFDAATLGELARLVTNSEAKPGQAEKIARVFQRIKSISAGQLKDELEQKRREKSKA